MVRRLTSSSPSCRLTIRNPKDLMQLEKRQQQQQQQQPQPEEPEEEEARTPAPIQELYLKLDEESFSNDDFGSFCALLSKLAVQDSGRFLEHVSKVYVSSSSSSSSNSASTSTTSPPLDWSHKNATALFQVLFGLPHLQCVTLSGLQHFPLTHVTLLLQEDRPWFQSLVLEACELTAGRITELERTIGSTTIVKPRSKDVEDFFYALDMHTKLCEFHSWQCDLVVATTTTTTTEANNKSDSVFNTGKLCNGGNRRLLSLMDIWIDHVAWALPSIPTLEVHSLQVPASITYPQHRLVVGLHQDTPWAKTTLKRWLKVLSNSNSNDTTSDRPPIEKMRLWLGPQYPRSSKNTKNSSCARHVLLQICHALETNTTLQCFSVRSSDNDKRKQKCITPAVKTAFETLLSLKDDNDNDDTNNNNNNTNTTLTNVDLMQQQGRTIDFYCYLNRHGRAQLLQSLHTMTPQQWMTFIICKFHKHPSTLYYYNRTLPLFLAQQA